MAVKSRATRNLMSTTMPGTVLFIRLFVAGACLLDGLRGVGFDALGRSVLNREPFGLEGAGLAVSGVALTLAGVFLLLGLLTRIVAVLPLLLSGAIVWAAFSTLDATGWEDGLNRMVRAFGVGAVSLLLLLRGAGVWSADASLTTRAG